MDLPETGVAASSSAKGVKGIGQAGQPVSSRIGDYAVSTVHPPEVRGNSDAGYARHATESASPALKKRRTIVWDSYLKMIASPFNIFR